MKILVLNGGSSSLKATLREIASRESERQAPVWSAHVEWGREPGKAKMAISGRQPSTLSIENPREVLEPVLGTLPGAVDVVGHRVVHGGIAYRDTTRITPDVKEGIRKYCEFAPEHNRLELEAIEETERILGAVPQIAVFDTAFHATIPEAANVYPGPYEWLDRGIRRYGFHGISHQYVSRRAAQMTSCPRLVSCHLGNGASLAAIRDGKSIDTTMGFTPLDGLMMGTRSGSVDPGILIYLVRHQGYDAAQLDRMLNRESGLKGIWGVSGDMREILLAIDRSDKRAKLAFDMYVHRLCREIGAMTASLGGMDALLFTAGIGENCPPLRAEVCRQLSFLGIHMDEEKNKHVSGDMEISAPDSTVRVLVVRTDEDWEIAIECLRVS